MKITFTLKEIKELFEVEELERVYRDRDRICKAEKFTLKHMRLVIECQVSEENLGVYATHDELSTSQQINIQRKMYYGF